MKKLFSIFHLVLAIGLVFCSAASVRADAHDIGYVDVGINGIYKTGYWVPVTVGLSSPSRHDGRVVIETVDPDGVPVQYESAYSQGEDRAIVYVRPGQKNASMKVSLFLDQSLQDAMTISPQGRASSTFDRLSRHVRFPLPIDSDRPVFLVLGQANLGIQDALDLLDYRDTNRPVILPVHAFADLPLQAIGYESVGTVVLTTEPAVYEGITADSLQVDALKKWLQTGGHVLISAGKESESLVSGDKAPLVAFLPGTFERMTTLRLASAYEIYAAQLQATGSTPMTMTGSDEAPFIEAPFLIDVSGNIEVRDENMPIVVQSARGLGLLTFVAGDLGAKPIADWKDRRLLVAKLLGAKERVSEKQFRTVPTMIQLGYHDMAGQLRSALDRFSEIKVVPFSMLVVIAIVYILLVGLGDWFLVHRILKRPILTWVTFPCWILLFCVLVVLVSGMFRTNRTLFNQVDLIDIDTQSGYVRGTSWMSLYSPQTVEYNLTFVPDTQGVTDTKDSARTQETWFGWFGLAGEGIGGMSAKRIMFSSWNRPYYLGTPSESIRGLPLHVASSKSLVANWTATGTSVFAGDLTEVDEIPSGHIINTLDCDLEQCFLVYGRWMIELKTVPAGTLVEVNTSCKRRDLRTVLAGGRNVFRDESIGSQMKAGKYNVESVDFPYILRTMMFYSAAGGQREFGLQNGYQQAIDMSRLLVTQNAIFIGVVKQDENNTFGPKVVCSDETPPETSARTTVIRAVFPVNR